MMSAMGSRLAECYTAALSSASCSTGCGGAGCSNRTDTNFETPGSCMVTPYSACAASMVRLACVMTMNCVSRGHFFDQPREPLDVGFIERRVHFVQNAERTGRVAEDGHQQRHGGQRFFAARKQQHVLQPLARRRGHDVDAAIRRDWFRRSDASRPGRRRTACWNISRKWPLMASKASLKRLRDSMSSS